MVPRFLSFLLILAFSFSDAVSARTEVKEDYLAKFINITTDEGLSSNNVLRIFQDSDGIMWFGTMNGLTRFDGHHYTIFRSSIADSTTLSDNKVTALAEDHEGNLWIGTDNGLNVMERKTGKIRRIFADECEGILSTNSIHALLCDRDGDIWVYSEIGNLSKYSVPSSNWQTISVYFIPDEGDYDYYNMIEDSKSKIWLSGRGSPNIFISDSASLLTFANYHVPTHIMEISSVTQTGNSDIWIGNQHKDIIFRYDALNDEISEPLKLPVSPKTMACDSSGILWIGGSGGVARFDPHTGGITHFQHDLNNPDSPVSNTTNHIFIDRDDNVWIGTDNGVSLYSKYLNSITHYRKIGSGTDGLSSNKITALMEDRDGLLWAGTDDNGVDTINLSARLHGNLKYSLIGVPLDEKTKERESFTLYQYRLHKMVSPRNENKVSSLYEDSDGKIYIGLWCHVGFNIYDKKGEQFGRYALWGVPTEISGELAVMMEQNPWGSNWYSGFLEDSKGRFWTATWEGLGMTLFDRQKQKFIGESYIMPSYFRNDLMMYLYLFYDTVQKRIWFMGHVNMYGFYDVEQKRFHKYAPRLRNGIINRNLIIDTYQKYWDVDYLNYNGTLNSLMNFNDGKGYNFFIKNGTVLARQNISDGSIEDFCRLPYPFSIGTIGYSHDNSSIYIFCGSNLYNIDLSSRKIKDVSEGADIFKDYFDQSLHLKEST